MNYYFLPGTGIYGGVKVGFQFAEMLAELGVPMVVATPDGQAPRWFLSSVPVTSRATALAAVKPDDSILFSLPQDHPEITATGARTIFHCQGTDPLIDPVLTDPAVTLLSCWVQADNYMREHSGRAPIPVGISISDCFFYDGTPKYDHQVAYMPRRGSEIADAVMSAAPHLQFLPIAAVSEEQVASAMGRSGYFLATSVGEWLGLPALEAMAGGCVVVSVPVLGGMEFLKDGQTARVAPAARIPETLVELSKPAQAEQRARIRDNGAALARRYGRQKQLRGLRELLAGELGEALSWT